MGIFLNSLSTTPKEVDLSFPYGGVTINDGWVPPCLLTEGADLFSQSLRQYSLSLKQLVMKANQLSPEVFWPEKDSAAAPYWPDLHTLAIRTTAHTANGQWALQVADERFPYPDWGDREDWIHELDELPEAIEDNEELMADYEIGNYPQHAFRIRPDHKFFDKLAISIARATSNMPKLKQLMYDMETSGAECEHHRFKGYAFSYDCGDDQNPPRTDWIFPCDHGQLLGWTQPAEASELWRKKCGAGLVQNILVRNGKGESCYEWEIWRDGERVGEQSSLSEHFTGYLFEFHDLLSY